jgi:uncharacterized damage-inducible protein DinB
MTDDIATLFAYNRWADRRILEVCRELTPEQLTAEPVAGWASVRSSLVHIARRPKPICRPWTISRCCLIGRTEPLN